MPVALFPTQGVYYSLILNSPTSLKFSLVSILVLMLAIFPSFRSFPGVTSMVNTGNSKTVFDARMLIDSFLMI